MNKYLPINKSGVTLLELIIAIMIIAIAVVPMTALFSRALQGYGDAQIITTMSFIGQFAMESILSADFSVLANEESDVDWFAFCQRVEPFNTNAYLYKFSYTVWVESINPDFTGDLTLDDARVVKFNSINSRSIGGNYLRIHVRVDYNQTNCSQPGEISLNFWTIVTPAGQGY